MADDPSPKQYGLCVVLGVLLGPIGAHRCYVGRWPTGLVQAAGTAAAGVWLVQSFGHVSFQADDWRVWPLFPPMVALLIWGLWPVIDIGRLLAGRFTDGAGRTVRP